VELDLDERRLRWLLSLALALVALGLWFFVLRGADQPADPVLEEIGGATTTLIPGVQVPEVTATTLSPSAPSIEAPGDPARVLFGGFEEVAIAVEPGNGGAVRSWCLLAARTGAQRANGMIGVEDLQGYDGMAFLYPEDVQNPYHMRGVPRPLSIAWFDADGEVVSTAEMEPSATGDEDAPLYTATGPYRFAIEVFQGGLDELGIVDGSRVTFAGPCAPAG
jgi:uncharacterized membrane protein (UPF0127 family)